MSSFFGAGVMGATVIRSAAQLNSVGASRNLPQVGNSAALLSFAFAAMGILALKKGFNCLSQDMDAKTRKNLLFSFGSKPPKSQNKKSEEENTILARKRININLGPP